MCEEREGLIELRGSNYRKPTGMPPTRREYMPGVPNVKVAKFSGGNPRGEFDVKLQMVAKRRVQIRHNALEAARIAINKKIEELGEDDYFLSLKVYPHVILRENKMIATAGADRLQEGMRKAFGKPVGLAARVDRGDVIFELSTKSTYLSEAEDALKTAAKKIPTPVDILKIPLSVQKA